MSSATAGLIARDRYLRTTRDPAIDRDLDRAMGVVADLMRVMPAFGFYEPKTFSRDDDRDSWVMNAWASQDDTDIPGTKGTVCFGFDLFRKELYEYDDTGATIMAIIAHEFAHILQGNRGYLARIKRGSPLGSEINADFLSGYFLGTRKRQNPALSFRKVGELFIRLGRVVEGQPDRTHGNSQERLDAAEAGFRAAYVENLSLDYAVAAGLKYVGDK
jgi:hypothetical protein